jgi:hypothetical protein
MTGRLKLSRALTSGLGPYQHVSGPTGRFAQGATQSRPLASGPPTASWRPIFADRHKTGSKTMAAPPPGAIPASEAILSLPSSSAMSAMPAKKMPRTLVPIVLRSEANGRPVPTLRSDHFRSRPASAARFGWTPGDRLRRQAPRLQRAAMRHGPTSHDPHSCVKIGSNFRAVV